MAIALALAIGAVLLFGGVRRGRPGEAASTACRWGSSRRSCCTRRSPLSSPGAPRRSSRRCGRASSRSRATSCAAMPRRCARRCRSTAPNRTTRTRGPGRAGANGRGRRGRGRGPRGAVSGGGGMTQHDERLDEPEEESGVRARRPRRLGPRPAARRRRLPPPLALRRLGGVRAGGGGHGRLEALRPELPRGEGRPARVGGVAAGRARPGSEEGQTVLVARSLSRCLASASSALSRHPER